MSPTVKFWITIGVTLAVAGMGTGTVILLRALDKATDWGEVKATVNSHTDILHGIAADVHELRGARPARALDVKEVEPASVIGMARRP